ncbi:hypothetical protein GS399_05105 [Pedobacter sp. HMF7647]|uniref:Uncharacterized protein n=1 Tax=Hufsiella arboris TaxID=2695275 RepID=A0A7K1Y6Y8_9SPHI|nr:hypothetical protein [Hufsiella arboris]MXV50342.1 hypothetical protein [Hufsiella arboris]
MVIKLPSRFSDNFGHPIQSLFSLLEQVQSASGCKEIELNYREAKFTHPFYTLALPLIKKQYGRSGQSLVINDDFIDASTSEYMNCLSFPNGIDPLDLSDSSFEKFMEKFQNKTYIPIITFPAGDGNEVSAIRDQFLSAINRLLVRISQIKNPEMGALMYLLDEAINNILHHSYDDCGYLLAQYYPSKGYIDIAIADIGRTLLESYQNFDKYKNQINTHLEAMKAALSGQSTKGGNVDRGFGISTSKEVLTKGLNGKYFIWSGNVFNIHNSELNNVIELPQTIYWQGVYLCLRIPVVAKAGFNLYNYTD